MKKIIDNTFGVPLAKLGRQLLGLRELLIVIVIGISGTSFLYSQQYEINLVTKGKFTVLVDGVLKTTHNEQKEAVESYLNTKLNNPTSDVKIYFPSEMVVDYTVTNEVDTLFVSGESVLLDYTDYGRQPTTKPIHYVFLIGEGVVSVSADTIYRWQNKFLIEKTKHYGYSSYRNLGLPFQFRSHHYENITSTSVTAYFSTTEKPTFIQAFLNGEVYKTFNTPYSDEISANEYEFFFGVSGLSSGTSYELRVEAVNDKGERSVVDNLWINTL